MNELVKVSARFHHRFDVLSHSNTLVSWRRHTVSLSLSLFCISFLSVDINIVWHDSLVKQCWYPYCGLLYMQYKEKKKQRIINFNCIGTTLPLMVCWEFRKKERIILNGVLYLPAVALCLICELVRCLLLPLPRAVHFFSDMAEQISNDSLFSWNGISWLGKQLDFEFIILCIWIFYFDR